MKNVCGPLNPKFLKFFPCHAKNMMPVCVFQSLSALSVKWKYIQPLLPKRTLNVLLNVYYYDDVEDING